MLIYECLLCNDLLSWDVFCTSRPFFDENAVMTCRGYWLWQSRGDGFSFVIHSTVERLVYCILHYSRSSKTLVDR